MDIPKKCPRDGEVLKETKYESVPLDACPKCNGMWCEGEELKRIVESRHRKFSPSDHADIQPDEKKAAKPGIGHETSELARKAPCPKCARPMSLVNYSYNSGITINRCMQGHGTWLDQSELERIQVFVERWEGQKDRIALQYSQSLQKSGAVAGDRPKGLFERMLGWLPWVK